MPVGEDWGRIIEKNIADSHLLVLLFTGPDDDWQWCLFETGFFLGHEFTGEFADEYRGVVCIYEADSGPPAPLKPIHGVPATQPKIAEFWKTLFRDTKLTRTAKAVSLDISDDIINKISVELSGYFEEKAQKQHACLPEVKFEIGDPDLVKAKGLPDDTVMVPNVNAANIFNLFASSTWGEMRSRVKSESSAWSDDLIRAIREAAEVPIPAPITATFRIWGSGKIFRPILYRVDRVKTRLSKCYVLFNQESLPNSIGGSEKSGLAFNAVRLVTRIRWEVIEHFIAQIEEDDLPKPIAIFFNQVKDSIVAIEFDEKDCNLETRDKLVKVFGSAVKPDVHPIVSAMMEACDELWDACTAQNLPLVSDALRKMRGPCVRFLPLAASRYTDLVAKEEDD